MYIDNWVPKARGFGSDRPTHLRGHIFWNFSSLHKHFWACYIHKNIKKYEKYTFFGEFDSLCNEPPLDFFQLCCSNNEVWRLVDQLDQKVELIKPGYFRYPHQNNSRTSSFLISEYLRICKNIYSNGNMENTLVY